MLQICMIVVYIIPHLSTSYSPYALVAMSFKTPVAKCSTHIPTLGTLDGWEYDNGVQQFCGIPYATLPKRWTRSCLKTSWEGEYHNGTKLGYLHALRNYIPILTL